MLVTISGAVRVTRAKDGTEVQDAEELRTLDGWAYQEDPCANYVDQDSLTDVDLQGGDVRLVWDARRKRLRVVTTYRVAVKLKPKQLAALRDETIGQWTDGVGASCFEKESKKLGVKLLLGAELRSVEAKQQEEESKTGAKPARVTIFGAIKRGSVEGVRKAIAAGEDLEAVRERNTPFLAAAFTGNVDILRLLLDAGVNVRATGVDRATALHSVACIRSEFISDEVAATIVDLVCARGADPMAVDVYGHSPLELALDRKKKRTAKALQAHGARLFHPTVQFQNPQGRPEAVRFMYGHTTALSSREGRSNREGEGKLENFVPGRYKLSALTDGVQIEPAEFTVLASGAVEPAVFTCRQEA